MTLEGKTTLVTGAGRGLGAAIAHQFAKDGAAVVAVGRHTAELDAVVAAVKAAGGRGLAVTADVCQEAQVERAISETLDAFGSLDAVVNNAGAFIHAARFPRLSVEEWDEAFNVNLKAPWLVAKHASAAMTEAGSITNVTSGLAHVAYAPDAPRTASVPYAPYSIAKGALEDLTRVLAARVKPRVNAVNPGVVRTAMSNGLGLAPEVVAPVFTWLASEAAEAVRGEVLLARDWLAEHPTPRPKKVRAKA